MQAYQARERISRTVNSNRSQQSAHRGAAFQSSAHSPVVQARIQEMANNSSHIKQLQAYQRMADNSNAIIQKKENKTGLPDRLKAGIEHLSGMDLSDVRVHYNSSKPAQLHAMAYAQGTDIYIAPGQEKHLPHEAWHVVQQKQGRVQPTTQAKGIPVNENKGLEKEADMMGAKALNETRVQQKKIAGSHSSFHSPVSPVQRYVEIDTSNDENLFQTVTSSRAFRTQFNPDTFHMSYTTNVPATNKLLVSNNGRLAIRGDDSVSNKTFFIEAEHLEQTNHILQQRNSDFILSKNGRQISVLNHPLTGKRHDFLEVESIYVRNRDVRTLETSCNIYHLNIAKLTRWIKAFTTQVSEGHDGEIDHERRLELHNDLAYFELIPGDAFKIATTGMNYLQKIRIWDNHFAGIIASDGPDQVTLEDFNRKVEGDFNVDESMFKIFKTTALEAACLMMILEKQLTNLNPEIDKGAITDLQKSITELNDIQKKITLATKETARPLFETNYFKMYGSPLQKQSFMDFWRSQVSTNESVFSVSVGHSLRYKNQGNKNDLFY